MLSVDTISLRHHPRRSGKNCDLHFANTDIQTDMRAGGRAGGRTDGRWLAGCQARRQTDRQTDRHTDIQTYRHTDIHTYIQTYRQTDGARRCNYVMIRQHSEYLHATFAAPSASGRRLCESVLPIRIMTLTSCFLTYLLELHTFWSAILRLQLWIAFCFNYQSDDIYLSSSLALCQG